MRCGDLHPEGHRRRGPARYVPGLLMLLFLSGAAFAVTGRVKGTVRDNEGRHAAGVPVRLYTVENGRKRIFMTNTDSQGEYRFESLAAGTYQLEVGGERYAIQRKDSIVVRPPFRNVIDFTLAPPEGGPAGTPRIPAGSGAGSDPAVESVARGGISGGLKDGDGIGVADARIILQGADRRYLAVSDPDGGFRIDDVPAGHYTLEVLSPGYLTVVLPGVILDGTGDIEFRLTLIDYPLDYRERVEDLLPPEQPLPPS